MLKIVGGVYRERCLRPFWDEIYGSAGRAARAIAHLGGEVELHSHVDDAAVQAMAGIERLTVIATPINRVIGFNYQHGLASPSIARATQSLPTLEVSGEKIVRYGMLDTEAVIHAKYAVYDPRTFGI